MGSCLSCFNCLEDFVELESIRNLSTHFDNDLPNADNPEFNNLNLGCFTNFIKDLIKAIKNDGGYNEHVD
tara:strand:+ start:527 stop:736 length:210 start_codon:yes stop_codon:yes gene_type:complete